MEILSLSDETVQQLLGTKCVIYAAGKNGKALVHWLESKGVTNVSFYDDDMSIWGGAVRGA